MSRTLVAGVGNIFLSDDAFGCEVVRLMAGRPVPAGVEVRDFGIRGVHLAYDLLERVIQDRAILAAAKQHLIEDGILACDNIVSKGKALGYKLNSDYWQVRAVHKAKLREIGFRFNDLSLVTKYRVSIQSSNCFPSNS